MSDRKLHEVAETIFEPTQRREAEIKDALKLEGERHNAVVSNMHRLRALRLARDANSKDK